MYKYIIEKNKKISENILSLRVRAKSVKDFFEFKPGQYVTISFTKSGRPTPVRCFSIASCPSEKGYLEFGIRIGGDFTTQLSKLKPGEEISIMGPFGHLICNPNKNSHIVLITGGIGITPFLSMIKASLSQNWQNKITLLYGAKSWDEAIYKSELIYHYKRNPNFEPYFFLSDESKKSKYENIINGTITAERLEKIFNGNFKDKLYFLCGPSGLMKAMKNILQSKNIPECNIISEEFSSASQEKTKKSHQSKVNSYTMAAIIISFFIILMGDVHKTNAKLANAESAQNIQHSNATQSQNSDNSTNSSSNSSNSSTNQTQPTQNQSTTNKSTQNNSSRTQSNSNQNNSNNYYSNPVTSVS
jgi:ferredoxin-NADP reductase